MFIRSPAVPEVAGQDQRSCCYRPRHCFPQRDLDFPMVEIIKALTLAELNVLGDGTHRTFRVLFGNGAHHFGMPAVDVGEQWSCVTVASNRKNPNQ